MNSLMLSLYLNLPEYDAPSINLVTALYSEAILKLTIPYILAVNTFPYTPRRFSNQTAHRLSKIQSRATNDIGVIQIGHIAPRAEMVHVHISIQRLAH